MTMPEAVIVSTARTPIGKAFRGAFNNTHGAVMAGHAISHAVARAKVEPDEVEDVVLGCGMPEGATGKNIARLSSLRAGLPVTTAATTINRLCSSGLQAIALASQRVMLDGVPVAVAGRGGIRQPGAGHPQSTALHRRVAHAAQAGAVDADDRDRRHRRRALWHQP